MEPVANALTHNKNKALEGIAHPFLLNTITTLTQGDIC